MLSRSLPLFLTLAWIYSVALTVKAVVREKETWLRCTMRAMGLSSAVLWLGWLLGCLGPFLLSSALLVLVLKVGRGAGTRGRGGARLAPDPHSLCPHSSGTFSRTATQGRSFCSWPPSPWPPWSRAS